MNDLRSLAASGIRWSALAHIGRRLVSLCTNVVMARLLLPSDFGLLAMVAVVLGFVELFRDLGTGSAIIQRARVSEDLLSSVFWLNAAFGAGATLVMFLIAPVVAALYQEPRVAPLLQVMSLGFFVSALAIVQNCLLTRELAFDRIAKIDLVSPLLSSTIGIGFALAGFGVWSLVIQVLTGNVATTAGFWLVGAWRPRLIFRWGEIRSVMGYSLNLTASNSLNYFLRNADNMLIGRFLGAESLGYYNLAYQLMLYPLQGLAAVIGRVMFPLYSRIQDDVPRFRKIYLQISATIGLIAFPIMLGVMAVREPAVLAIFGAQWSPVIELLAFFAPLGAVQAVATTVGAIYQAKGRTDLMLKWVMAASVVVLVSFVIGLQWGVVGVAAAYTLASTLLLYPGFAIPFRLIDLPVVSLLAVLWRPLVAALAMLALVLALDQQLPAGLDPIRRLAVLVPAGAIAYGALIWLMDRALVLQVLEALRPGR